MGVLVWGRLGGIKGRGGESSRVRHAAGGVGEAGEGLGRRVGSIIIINNMRVDGQEIMGLRDMRDGEHGSLGVGSAFRVR